MRFLALRNEEPPDDTVVVIRGGEMASEYVRRTARDAFEETGIYSLSVYLTLDAPVDELCRGEPFLARYGKVRLSTAGRLRRAGFVLLATLPGRTMTSCSQTPATEPCSASSGVSTRQS